MQDQRDGGAPDRARVRMVLDDFLDRRAAQLQQLGASEFAALLRGQICRGKWLRPVLCCAGWRAGGGTGPVSEQVAAVAGSLELFHCFALIHDDVMDGSDTRHGQPTMYRMFAARHAGRASAPLPGADCAILAGDLALGWSYELLADADPPASVRRLLETMRTETLIGQYLDLTTGPDGGVDAAVRVCRLKTAAYTVQRPLQVGALLAGASAAVVEQLGEVGNLVGEAFQLRDDLLGVFGDPACTGKPVTDDLREGKNTALLALARERATPAQARLLADLVGNPGLDEDGTAAVREVLVTSGARALVEDLITERWRHAEALLTTIDTTAAAGIGHLRAILASATGRDH